MGQGLYGAFFVKFNLQVAAFRRTHLSNYGVAEAVTLASLTAMIGYFNIFIRIDMTECMAILFRECEGGGDFDNLCQLVFPPCITAILLNGIIPQILCPMAHGKFITTSDGNPHGSCCRFLWLQSTRWHFRAVNGHWRDIWSNGWYHGEGNVSVGTEGL